MKQNSYVFAIVATMCFPWLIMSERSEAQTPKAIDNEATMTEKLAVQYLSCRTPEEKRQFSIDLIDKKTISVLPRNLG
jgi:hypothetical protein